MDEISREVKAVRRNAKNNSWYQCFGIIINSKKLSFFDSKSIIYKKRNWTLHFWCTYTWIYEVLKRRKFSKYPDFIQRAETLLADIERKSVYYYPTETLYIINDFADNRLLELAEKSGADFLITGNTNDFTIESYKKTKIISPKDYYINHYPL
jgi:putative PIN family toxin of toxin-antitoxin system